MLGTWWEEDRVSFVEVTVGTSRMYAIMRALRRQMPLASHIHSKSAIFASVPGETHVLGVRMAADLLRKEGWDIELKIGRTHEELVVEMTNSGSRIEFKELPADDPMQRQPNIALAKYWGKRDEALNLPVTLIDPQGNFGSVDGFVDQQQISRKQRGLHRTARNPDWRE